MTADGEKMGPPRGVAKETLPDMGSLLSWGMDVEYEEPDIIDIAEKCSEVFAACAGVYVTGIGDIRCLFFPSEGNKFCWGVKLTIPYRETFFCCHCEWECVGDERITLL